MEFAAEDSWRGASNNLKVIVAAVLSHVCRNSRWSLVKWCDPGDLHEVKSGTTTIAGGVVSSIELFRTLNTCPGVVGGQPTSANRDKLFDSRPAVHSPLYCVN